MKTVLYCANSKWYFRAKQRSHSERQFFCKGIYNSEKYVPWSRRHQKYRANSALWGNFL